MATIRYFAKGAYQSDIAEIHGISQQSMSGIIREVSTALAKRMREFINFPTNLSEIQKLKSGFYRIAAFPQCVGAIDCTHIKIKSPGGELGGRYRCRKGFYSLNVQVICDAEYKIRDIVSRWRGSAHDSRIWRESAIKATLERTELRNGVLLGDAGYSNSRILLTPFKFSATNTLTAGEKKYNEAHILTRNVVEKVFGQLKNKFRICFNGLNVNLDTAKTVVVAIAILYNISKESKNSLFADDCYYDPEEEEQQDTQTILPERAAGSVVRTQFIN